MDGFRLGFGKRIDMGCNFYEDVKGGVWRDSFGRGVGAVSRVIDGEVLIGDFLVRRSMVFSFFVWRLMEAAFCARVFRLFASIRATFRGVATCCVFRLNARGDIAFSKFCIGGFGTRVRFSIRASANSILSILDVGRA